LLRILGGHGGVQLPLLNGALAAASGRFPEAGWVGVCSVFSASCAGPERRGSHRLVSHAEIW
jgi:hypothetical protein